MCASFQSGVGVGSGGGFGGSGLGCVGFGSGWVGFGGASPAVGWPRACVWRRVGGYVVRWAGRGAGQCGAAQAQERKETRRAAQEAGGSKRKKEKKREKKKRGKPCRGGCARHSLLLPFLLWSNGRRRLLLCALSCFALLAACVHSMHSGREMGAGPVFSKTTAWPVSCESMRGRVIDALSNPPHMHHALLLIDSCTPSVFVSLPVPLWARAHWSALLDRFTLPAAPPPPPCLLSQRSTVQDGRATGGGKAARSFQSPNPYNSRPTCATSSSRGLLLPLLSIIAAACCFVREKIHLSLAANDSFTRKHYVYVNDCMCGRVFIQCVIYAGGTALSTSVIRRRHHYTKSCPPKTKLTQSLPKN